MKQAISYVPYWVIAMWAVALYLLLTPAAWVYGSAGVFAGVFIPLVGHDPFGALRGV